MLDAFIQYTQIVVDAAWHDGIGTLLLLIGTLALLFLRVRPMDRHTLGSTLLLLGLGLLGQLVSVALGVAGFARLGKGLHEVFLLMEGLAVIRLFGLFALRMALPALHLPLPRIVEDILVFLAYLGWGIVRLHVAGLDLSGIVTTSAVITAVLAFSMQDTLGNILGGLVLQLDNSMRIGDWIKIGELSGKVVEMRWRYTAIETRNGETVIVPNSQLMKANFQVLGRHGHGPIQLRRSVWFSVGYHSAPALVMHTVEQAMRSAVIPNVARTPAANCVVMDFSDHCARYAVRYWLTNLQADDPTDSQVRDHIYTALQRANIRLFTPLDNQRMTKEDEVYRDSLHAKDIAQRVASLRKIELLHSLSDDELRGIAEKLKYTPFAKGQIITQQGDFADWLYMVSEGEVDVYLETPKQGKRKFKTLLAGNFFGAMGLFTGAERSATVVAASSVVCYRLDKASFEQVLQKRPALAEEISRVLVLRRDELDLLQQDMEHRAYAQQQSLQHQDVLQRIRQFFNLDSKP